MSNISKNPKFVLKVAGAPGRGSEDLQTTLKQLQEKWQKRTNPDFDSDMLQWLSLASCCIPELSLDASKGQAGRVGVVGGSLEYTGAPFFAAKSALLAGMDLSHIFCELSAGTAIKGYSPELIVHPVLRTSPESAGNQAAPQSECIQAEQLAETSAEAVKQWIPRLDALLIGPGLGRNPTIIESASRVIIFAASRGQPILLDADGLFILTLALSPESVMSASLASTLREALASCPLTLTPNRVEFERLCQSLGLARRGEACFDRRAELAAAVAAAVGKHTIVVAKGAEDVISDGTTTVVCRVEGSPRRCGGQGDVLAGLLLAMRTWTDSAIEVARGRFEECAVSARFGRVSTRPWRALVSTLLGGLNV